MVKTVRKNKEKQLFQNFKKLWGNFHGLKLSSRFHFEITPPKYPNTYAAAANVM